jgi:hypothetical protein
MIMKHQPLTSVILCFAACLPWSIASADSGDPIAIHRTQGAFAIETMWNLGVQIVTANEFVRTDLEGVDLIRHPAAQASVAGRIQHAASAKTTFDQVLDRPANTATASWSAASSVAHPSSNAVRVRAAGPVIVIDVDGVRVTYIDHEATELTEATRAMTSGTSVLIVGPGNGDSQADELVDSRWLVLADAAAKRSTMAVCARAPDPAAARTIIGLSDQPTVLPTAVEELMQAKEAACRESQRVFATLSVNQMNFRPQNGTHTPRWNVEHMMGRELLFFSQIFHVQDPVILVIDLNPKQMPLDYQAKHADWTGEEEARQMERVTRFTRRFAYLLQDLPLDEKPPGSGWTLRGLLRQMDRHYSEHTANVVKKFELEDWPAR